VEIVFATDQHWNKLMQIVSMLAAPSFPRRIQLGTYILALSSLASGANWLYFKEAEFDTQITITGGEYDVKNGTCQFLVKHFKHVFGSIIRFSGSFAGVDSGILREGYRTRGLIPSLSLYLASVVDNSWLSTFCAFCRLPKTTCSFHDWTRMRVQMTQRLPDASCLCIRFGG
jgi:hypothetical protein